MRKIGSSLDDAIEGYALAFADEERLSAEEVVDEFNAKTRILAFWNRSANWIFKDICDSFVEKLGNANIPAPEWLQFNLFQLITCNLARAARDNKELRCFAGIRRSLFRR